MLPLQSAATTITHTAEVIATSMAEAKLDPELIAQTKQSLIDAATSLTDNRFPIMGTIHDTSFGTDQAGLNLSKHHELAHKVMDETIKGVTKDVEEFCINLITAVKLFQTADSDAAADIKQADTSGCEKTQYQSSHSHGDDAHQQAQQEVQQQHRPRQETRDGRPARSQAQGSHRRDVGVGRRQLPELVGHAVQQPVLRLRGAAQGRAARRRGVRRELPGRSGGAYGVRRTAGHTDERSTQTSKVSSAIAEAYGAMQRAQAAHTAMGKEPDKPTPTVDPTAPEQAQLRQGIHDGKQMDTYDQQMADRETKAKAALDDHGQDLRRVGRGHEEHPQPRRAPRPTGGDDNGGDDNNSSDDGGTHNTDDTDDNTNDHDTDDDDNDTDDGTDDDRDRRRRRRDRRRRRSETDDDESGTDTGIPQGPTVPTGNTTGIPPLGGHTGSPGSVGGSAAGGIGAAGLGAIGGAGALSGLGAFGGTRGSRLLR